MIVIYCTLPTTPNHLDSYTIVNAVEQLQPLNTSIEILLTNVDV
ncbi:hypothetical protein [cyanobacterium endosymbiont of Rhopalodia gibberula]|nr:hypothetical protein [cyanobacterium endosymbiont of Rhopalodia gibberula]